MNPIDVENGTSACTGLNAQEMVAALEEYQEGLRRGQSVDHEAFLARHGDIAGQLAGYLEALDLIQSVGGETTPPWESQVHPSPLGPGDTLGEFRILREVGRGGMGVVYEAEQLGIPERRVALKVLPRAASLDPRTFHRFRVETQAAACLNHPNIVPVFSAGCERDIPFYAMPLIKGRSLAQVMSSAKAKDTATALTSPPTPAKSDPGSSWYERVAHVGIQAAEALEHAHALGVVHRDIKPSNLIVDSEWRLWVADFGLARLARNDPGLTNTGELVGTLRYISPEQIRAEPGAGDARADIYALGVTLYEALTLRPVFATSDRSALLHHILNDEPPHPRSIDASIPRDLETIVLKAMDKLPAARYATAQELADDLRRFLDDLPILARRPGPAERSLRWARKHRALLATAVAGLVLSMAIGTIMLWRAKQQADQTVLTLRAAHYQERLAFEGLFLVNDMITVPLIDEAARAGTVAEARRQQMIRQLVFGYDQIAKIPDPGEHQVEVIAKAARRAGSLRLRIGDRRALDDLARAVDLYEAMAARKPRMIAYRAHLISTLRGYVGALEKDRDPRANAFRRRACEIAESLLADEDARLDCFRVGVIKQFEALVEMLDHVPNPAPSDRSLAARMTKWLEENPEPTGKLILFPEP
jgi:serine/threonine protein kinase